MNPYKELRQLAGYTQKKFCDEFGFSKQTLISIEAGVYADLSDRMLAAIYTAAENKGVVSDLVGNLDAAYEMWRLAERQNVIPAVKKYLPVVWDEKMSPMGFFIAQTTGSVQGFAKRLKVQTSTLLRYVSGEQPDMPMPLRVALVDCGYEHLGQLEKAQMDWVRDYVK
jgi:transcriptional regulator with XRE-family HTH domain